MFPFWFCDIICPRATAQNGSLAFYGPIASWHRCPMIAHVSHRPSPKGPAIFTDDDLRTLLQRNQSSPRFHERLRDALCRTEFDDYVQNLQPDKSAKIVDYLDKVRIFRQI